MWSQDVLSPGSFCVSRRIGRLLPFLTRQPRLCALAKRHEAQSGILVNLRMHLGNIPRFANSCRVINGAHLNRWCQRMAILHSAVVVSSILGSQNCLAFSSVMQCVSERRSTCCGFEGILDGSGEMRCMVLGSSTSVRSLLRGRTFARTDPFSTLNNLTIAQMMVLSLSSARTVYPSTKLN